MRNVDMTQMGRLHLGDFTVRVSEVRLEHRGTRKLIRLRSKLINFFLSLLITMIFMPNIIPVTIYMIQTVVISSMFAPKFSKMFCLVASERPPENCIFLRIEPFPKMDHYSFDINENVCRIELRASFERQLIFYKWICSADGMGHVFDPPINYQWLLRSAITLCWAYYSSTRVCLITTYLREIITGIESHSNEREDVLCASTKLETYLRQYFKRQ